MNLYNHRFREVQGMELGSVGLRSDGVTFNAMMVDGAAVEVVLVDKENTVPGFKESGQRFDALTTWIRLTFAVPRGPNAETVMENYLQVDLHKVGGLKDNGDFRLEQDSAALWSMGVDKASVPVEIFEHRA